MIWGPNGYPTAAEYEREHGLEPISDPAWRGLSGMICPKCGRRGQVRRVPAKRVAVEHRCPGPWTLQAVTPLPDRPYGESRFIFRSLTGEDIVRAGWPARTMDYDDSLTLTANMEVLR